MEEKKKQEHNIQSMYLAPLLAGGIAGLSVDVALYPLDTMKTRLQCEQGFWKSGGFKGIYRGLLTVATTSVPTSSLFFVSYETTKRVLQPMVALQYAPLVHMAGACVGEVIACVIRVPTEIAKQRKQTNTKLRSSIAILVEAYKTEGLRKGVYRGFLSTVARDLPFSFIELPLWEMMKTFVRRRNDGDITSIQSALCGSLAGGIAAGVTTPLDVAKTRIMLAHSTRRLSLTPVLFDIYVTGGVRGLFAGAAPRIAAFMAGGMVFFGAYDYTKAILEDTLNDR